MRPLVEGDLAEADRIVRLAFGTFLGLPDPSRFMGDAAYVRTRWKADPSAALAAEQGGKLVGSNFAANWGSFGFFGPLTIAPEYWSRGVAQRLLASTMDIFHRWGNRHLGLYTFAHSAMHVALYQKFGFWPRDLVAVMAKGIPNTSPLVATGFMFTDVTRYSTLDAGDREHALRACREVSDAIFPGLDLGREILAVFEQSLGDTIVVWDGAKAVAFAVCHAGAGTEAGGGACYVKFAAVNPGTRAGMHFERLLEAVESFASYRGAKKITAGVNLARREAFAQLRARGYRTEMQGVAMETGDASAGYNRAGVYILDDWR